MRIHSDIITPEQVTNIIDATPVVTIGRMTVHNSRSRARGIELNLYGSGRQGGQFGNADGKSATWDEWGHVIAALYRIDPVALVGPYFDRSHFYWVTAYRYAEASPFHVPVTEQHVQHKWEPQGMAVTGRYYTQKCKCGALTRRLAQGVKWADLA